MISSLLLNSRHPTQPGHSWAGGAERRFIEPRSVDVINRLTRTGGAGSTVVEGHVNEFSEVTVNGEPAEMRADPVAGGYRFRRSVPVTEGANTLTVSADDTGNPPETTTKSWTLDVPGPTRTFTYDANGNTLSDGERTFTWDAKNRLRTVTKGGTTWKWDYDYRDRRVREYTNGTLTKQYVWSGTEIIQERNAANAVTRTHCFGGFVDGPTPTTGTKYHTLTDHLGHVREVLTPTGTVAARYDYTPYQGPVKIGTSTVDPTFLTIGRYQHHAGSGLELALYRAYDPELGRWLSEDPIGEMGGLNLYGFVADSPISHFDSLGLVDWSEFGSSINVSLGIGLEAGVKKCKLGPLDIRGPSLGVSLKSKFDLAGGHGQSLDSSANLVTLAAGANKIGLGAFNESGWYEPAGGGPTKLIDRTEKVCGLKRGGTKWSSKSPWTLGAEVSLGASLGLMVDFKQLWNSLWK